MEKYEFMLKKVIITNVSSIGKCEVDLEKGNYKFLDKNTKGEIVNPLAIYGHNGSGKTSFFKAIDQLVRLMIDTPNTLIPFVVNNFKFEDYFSGKNKEIDNVIGRIDLFFSIGSNEYTYTISTNMDIGIVKEILIADNKIIIDRQQLKYSYNNNSFTLNPLDSMLVPVLRKLASEKIADPYIQKAFDFISSFNIVYADKIQNPSYGFVTSQKVRNISTYDLITSKAEEVSKVIEEYKDFPIYRIVKKNIHPVNNIPYPGSSYFIEFRINNQTRSLPFEFISNGMRNQSVILSLILTLPENAIIFVDELDNALHPSTLSNFLDFVRERGVQMIFSSHNTNILQSLRPDQIYFADWKDGVSRYSRLSTIYPNIREINNIEKMYLSRVFDEAIKKNE